MLPHWKTAIALAFVPAVGSRLPIVLPQPVEAFACWGDVNGDTRVDVADAHLIARYAIGMRVVDREAVIARGDVTGDGAVNVSDAQQVARHSIGLPAALRLRESLGLPRDGAIK